MARLPRFLRRSRHSHSHRSHRERRTIAALAIVAAVFGIAGIALVAKGGSSPTTKASARSTTSGYGAIPNAAAPLVGSSPPKATLGIGEFCDEFTQINQRFSPVGQYAYLVGDLGLLRSTLANEVGALDNLAARAPVEIRAGMEQIATDAHQLNDATQKAETIEDVRTIFGQQFPPIYQRNGPTLKWIQTNCPKAPQATSS